MFHCDSELQAIQVPEVPLSWTDGTCQNDGQRCRTRSCSLLASLQGPSWLTEQVFCINLEEKWQKQLQGQFLVTVLLSVPFSCFHFCDLSLFFSTFLSASLFLFLCLLQSYLTESLTSLCYTILLFESFFVQLHSLVHDLCLLKVFYSYILIVYIN